MAVWLGPVLILPRTALCTCYVLVLTSGPDVMEKEEKLDSRRHVSPGCRFCVPTGDSEQALIPDSDEDAKPFLLRFLLQETIFVHSLVDDLTRRPVGGNFLTKSDGIFLQENRRHRVRRLADPDRSQPLILARWTLDPPHVMQNTSSPFAILTLTSATTAQTPLHARSVLGQEPLALMSAPAKPWEVDAQERSRRARRLLIQATL